MSDLVTTARTARERLSVGLNALQDPGLPESLQAAAEPIAQAMSMLLQIERTSMLPITKGGPSVLDLVRQALAKLQSQTVEHPALFAAMESVAGSLGLVFGLVQRASSAPPPAQSTAASSNPQKLVASAAVATAPRVAPAQPVPTSSQPAATYSSNTRPQVAGGAPAGGAPRPQQQAEASKVQPSTPPGTLLSSRQSTGNSVSNAIAAAMQIPAGGTVGSAPAMAAGGTRLSNPGSTPPVAKTPSSPPLAAATRPAPAADRGTAAPTPAPATAAASTPLASSGTPLQRVSAELGAHSATNFYKGLSGNDVVDSGGIFVATYQVPPIGKQLVIRVSLPGGYEFEAKAVVRWTRDTNSGSGESSPGFGAQFTEISPEARQLVYRYARNREPLFHDDL
jgi:hypothetical protein